MFVKRIGTGEHAASRQHRFDAAIVTFKCEPHAIADGERALATHGNVRRHDAFALNAAIEHAASRAHHRHHDRGIRRIRIVFFRRRMFIERFDHFAHEHLSSPRMSMLVEQRLPILLGHFVATFAAFVANERAAQLSGGAPRLAFRRFVVPFGHRGVL